MSVDAYIEVRRVVEGEYLISDDHSVPQFVVREPVCVVGIHGLVVEATGVARGRYVALDTHLVEGPLRLGHAQLVLLGTDAVAVLSHRSFESFPGCVDRDETEAAWKKITPGRWVVTHYYVLGMGEDGANVYLSPHSMPQGLVLGETVKWRIWT